MTRTNSKVGPSRTVVAAPDSRHRWRRLLIAGVAAAFVGFAVLWAAYLALGRTPGELIRYTERRLIGHNKLQYVILPIFNLVRPLIERPVIGPLPTLGKGQQTHMLPPQNYTTEGRPISAEPARTLSAQPPTGESVFVNSATAIQQAITSARPGQVIEIAPGTYTITSKIRVHHAGTPQQPITLRAHLPGSVIIQFATIEGFYVTAPYWLFENLTIRGDCLHDDYCEHAFHIVGKARSTVIRNNRIEDFNAQIKVNGLNGDWPDDGLIQYNTLANTRRRETHLPVTPIDIVGADRWLVADNVISNFVKGKGDRVSYGVFMKGAGSNGRIEHNLIICTSKDISQPGARVGLSLGGGGTDKGSCRDQRCITEHSHGSITDNVIAHCNDFGIYINKANQSTILNNTLANTYGIDVRFPAASAHIEGNILDGVIRRRDDATITQVGNQKSGQ